jgi:hypothetical protein
MVRYTLITRGESLALAIDRLKEFTRRQWKYLLQIGAWIMLILGSFVLPPPIWDFKEDAIWFHFTHFVVSVLVGLVFLPMNSWSGRQHRWWWWTLASVFLVLGIIVFFVYLSLRGQWTAPYSGGRVVIGTTYKPEAIAYKTKIRNEEKREISDEELIMDSAGNRSSIWDDTEMHRRRLFFGAVYMAAISLFALTMIAVIQALYCSTRPKRRKAILAST